MSACLYCSGLGQTGDGHFVKICTYCKGTGCNQSAPFKPVDDREVCDVCGGEGGRNNVKCKACKGSGKKGRP